MNHAAFFQGSAAEIFPGMLPSGSNLNAGTCELTLGQEREQLEARLVVLVLLPGVVLLGRGWRSLPDAAAGICFPAQVAVVAFGLLVVQKV